MKKITVIIMFIMPFIGFSQTLINTTFDTNTNGWAANPAVSASISYDAVEGSAASGSLKLVSTVASDRAQTTPNIEPINGAGDYTLTFKVKGPAGAKVQGTSFQTGNIKSGAQLTLTGGWDLYTATLTGINTSVMNIRLVAIDPGTYFFDDVTWTYVIPSGNTVLTTNIVGSGSLTKSPNQPSYTPSTSVTLTATPSTHWIFSNWSGDLTGSINPASLAMSTNKNVTANFSIDNTFNYAFLYNTDGNLEGWTTDPLFSVSAHSSGLVTLTPTPNQFARFSLFNFPIPTANYNKLTITLKNNSATTDQLTIVIGTGIGSVFSYPITTSDSTIQSYEINLTAFATWLGDVNSLRIRFADADNPDLGKPSDAGTIVLDNVVFSFDPALEVNDNDFNNDVAVYPNPVSNVLNINSERQIDSVIIFNISGQKVIENTSSFNGQIDVAKLTSGIYFVKVTSNNSSSTIKFIKK
jgi:hypothetical protein